MGGGSLESCRKTPAPGGGCITSFTCELTQRATPSDSLGPSCWPLPLPPPTVQLASFARRGFKAVSCIGREAQLAAAAGDLAKAAHLHRATLRAFREGLLQALHASADAADAAASAAAATAAAVADVGSSGSSGQQKAALDSPSVAAVAGAPAASAAAAVAAAVAAYADEAEELCLQGSLLLIHTLRDNATIAAAKGDTVAALSLLREATEEARTLGPPERAPVLRQLRYLAKGLGASLKTPCSSRAGYSKLPGSPHSRRDAGSGPSLSTGEKLGHPNCSSSRSENDVYETQDRHTASGSNSTSSPYGSSNIGSSSRNTISNCSSTISSSGSTSSCQKTPSIRGIVHVPLLGPGHPFAFSDFAEAASLEAARMLNLTP